MVRNPYQKNLFKSITFDCGKEFSKLEIFVQPACVAIYFADPENAFTKRALNENSNGLLRKDGLAKRNGFSTKVDPGFRIVLLHTNGNIIQESQLNYQHRWKFL